VDLAGRRNPSPAYQRPIPVNKIEVVGFASSSCKKVLQKNETRSPDEREIIPTGRCIWAAQNDDKFNLGLIEAIHGQD
jgi:hypothetical protein